MIDFIKKYKLIFLLLILVIILIVVKITSKTNTNSPNIENQITPTPTITATPTFPLGQNQVFEEVNPDYPLEKALPYKTENFIVEKYKSPMILEVKLLSGDKTKAETEIKTWIESIMEEKNTHTLVWVN